MLRDSDGDIGGGKFTRSGSSALSSYFYLPELLLLASDPLYLFERLERHKLGRGAKKGTAKRDPRATKGDLSWISAGCHYSSRTPHFGAVNDWGERVDHCAAIASTRRSAAVPSTARRRSRKTSEPTMPLIPQNSPQNVTRARHSEEEDEGTISFPIPSVP